MTQCINIRVRIAAIFIKISCKLQKISIDHFKVTLHSMSTILWAQTIFSSAQSTMTRYRHPLEPATNSLTNQINASTLCSDGLFFSDLKTTWFPLHNTSNLGYLSQSFSLTKTLNLNISMLATDLLSVVHLLLIDQISASILAALCWV